MAISKDLWGWLTNMPEVVEILRSEEVGKGVRTLRFEYHHKVMPGQFFMV